MDVSQILGLAGVIITIGSVVLSVYFYAQSRRTKQVQFTFRSGTLQAKAHPDVTISYAGHEISNLSRAVVACWNAGTEDIRSSDCPRGEWPRAVLPSGSRFLSASLLGSSSADIAANIMSTADGVIQFEFTYINPGDVIVAEILYEASGGDQFTFRAPIIGGIPPRSSQFAPPIGLQKHRIVGLIASFFLGLGASLFYFAIIKGDIWSSSLGVGSAIVALVSVTIVAFTSVVEFRADIRHIVPTFARQFLK